MVKELESVIHKAGLLPEDEQRQLAAILEEEMADEARWDKRFAETSNTLAKIVERARRQYEQGLCSDL